MFGEIQAYIFDYFPWEGTEPNLHYFQYERANTLLFACHYPKGFHLVPSLDGYQDNVFNKLVARGGEGVMLKNKNAFYQPGKRPQATWYKIKKFLTMDVYVVDAEPGNGKYEGQIGALYFSDVPYPDSNNYLGKCSGMTDIERLEWTRLFDFYNGYITTVPAEHRLIEVKYYGKAGENDRGLRHPQYLKWKKPE